MKAIVINERGAEEVMVYADHPDPVPGPEDVVVDIEAAGVNFIDIYQRSGLYEIPLPFIPGSEGAGTVSAIGADVVGVTVGQRVAWSGALGSYAEKVSVPERSVVTVPDSVSMRDAAAAMLQGLTAHYLVTSTHRLTSGEKCLIHAGAGGVGAILIQMAKRMGAEVFATVGSMEKVAVAREAGADHVIVYSEVDFAQAVIDIAGPKCLDVVYDGVGQATFSDGIALLRRRGTMATFGNASGPVEPVSPLLLMQLGSLYLTRPSLGDYLRTREELEWRAGELFSWIGDGTVKLRIGLELALQDAPEAHRQLASRATTGKVILIP